MMLTIVPGFEVISVTAQLALCLNAAPGVATDFPQVFESKGANDGQCVDVRLELDYVLLSPVSRPRTTCLAWVVRV